MGSFTFTLLYHLDINVTEKASNTKTNLTLCLINEATSYEDVWGNGCVTPLFLTTALYGGEQSA
jgi:hypothetical protein